MSTKKDAFTELNLRHREEEILEWGLENYPQFVKNKNLIAQLWYTSVDGKILPSPYDVVSVESLRQQAKEMIESGDTKTPEGKDKKVWGVIEVLVVGPLADSPPYFGCPNCLFGVDKNVGVCHNETKHPGEIIEGELLAWQNWQAGDSTDGAILSFAPNNKQTPEGIQQNILVLRGGLELRSGRFSVWEIIKNIGAKPLKAMKTKAPEPEEEKETIIDEEQSSSEESVVVEDESDIDEDKIFGKPVEESKEEVETVVETDLGIPDIGKLEKLFHKTLKKYASEKPIPIENMLNWLTVQPQIRGFDSKEIKLEKAQQYLKAKEAEGSVTVVGDKISPNVEG